MPARPLTERVFMLAFFTAFLFFLVKAYAAARRRDFARHRAWMLRMFFTGLTITTQRLLVPVFIVFAGIDSTEEFWNHFVTAAWLAWVVQLALAEWWIARGTAPALAAPARKPAAV
jgi:ABC-type glycerol-3-phosphate transport system permease component